MNAAETAAGRPKAPWVLIPVKAFTRGKSRLSGVLAPDERFDLARSLLTHVLDVLEACPELGGVMVVTGSDEVAEFACARGAVVADDEATGLGAIIDAALANLHARGVTAALVLMSDLPLLEAADLQAVLAAMRDADVVLVPDYHEEMTNALGLALPARFATSFGTRGSFRAHRATAEEAGLRITVHRNARIERDIDEPADLARLRAGER